MRVLVLHWHMPAEGEFSPACVLVRLGLNAVNPVERNGRLELQYGRERNQCHYYFRRYPAINGTEVALTFSGTFPQLVVSILSNS